MSIEAAYAHLMEGARWNAETERITDERAKVLAMSVLEGVDATVEAFYEKSESDIRPMDWEDILAKVRAQIAALAPQEPPEQEG